ncbi:uncharacterized protein RSE6_14583 [Rhynchosporium secalis]|uniref:FAR1 domain-containing protein n=1 Tax=Rhynchosporium secalis TaxID=38038 RepID=A0A1E1MVP9_RHYSE|nr:uncharacterized protein RSE6_14583 [Rhynchosporium secalis]
MPRWDLLESVDFRGRSQPLMILSNASILIACGPAPPVATYSDMPTDFTTIQAYAKAHGYALRQKDIRLLRALCICDRAGKYDLKGKQSLIEDRASGQWQVKFLEAIHNHTISKDSIAHLVHRIASIPAETRVTISSLAKASVPNAQILLAL